MKRNTLVIILAVAFGGCASDSGAVKDGGQPPVADSAVSSAVSGLRLSDQISGWSETSGSYTAFTAATMFQLINGGAQPHVDRGLVAGIFQTMAKGSTRNADLFAEDFGSAAKAQAMFTYMKGQVADPLALTGYSSTVAGDVVLGGAVFHALFGQYYFSLTFTGYSVAERQELLSDAGLFVAAHQKLVNSGQ